MASFLRHKVSKQKKRYKKDGFDLDLAYITPRIIAMGFPSKKTEGVYRNPIGQVYKFYEHYHKDHYKLYNLCAERKYDEAKFHNRVSQYPFLDHNAPPMDLIVECCKDIDDWLNQDALNVVGINCKAGKGRTGLIICCYLLYSKLVKDTDEALSFYGSKRTKDGKGVTIASQQRYIRYYEKILGLDGTVPPTKPYYLQKIILSPPPSIPGVILAIVVIKGQEVFHSIPLDIDKKASTLEIECKGTPIMGDVKVQFIIKKGGSPQKLYHFWINTSFVEKDDTYTLLKKEIDVANKDKKHVIYKQDFKVQLICKPVIGEEKEKQEQRHKLEQEKKEQEKLNDLDKKRRRMSFYNYSEYAEESSSEEEYEDFTEIDDIGEPSVESLSPNEKHDSTVMSMLDIANEYDKALHNNDSQSVQIEVLKRENDLQQKIIEQLKKEIEGLKLVNDKCNKDNAKLLELLQDDPRQLSTVKQVKILYDFMPKGEGEVAVSPGMIATVLEEREDWYNGKLSDGTEGWFPKSFCEDV